MAKGAGAAHRATKGKQYCRQVEQKFKVVVDSPQEVLECKVQRWTEIWRRRHDDQWEELQRELQSLVVEARSEEHHLGPIVAKQVDKAIRRYPENKGQRADQYTTELMFRLPPEAIEQLAQLLGSIEEWVLWPVSVLINLVIFFEKPAGGTGP